MLNTLIDRDPTTSIATPAEFGVREAELKIERLFTLAADANPELAVLEHEIERDRQALRLAKLAYWPDFTLGFEWMQMDPRDAFEPPINPATGMRPPSPQLSEDGSDNWAIVFGFSLPIWFDKIEAGIREARYQLSASRRRYASTRNLVNFRITDALEQVRSQRELALLFDKTIIPQSRQAYEVSRDGYAAGRNDFEAMIDNWERWFLFSIQYHRALGALERSVADLEQNIGMSLTQAQGGPAANGAQGVSP
jgi:outer membrane protein TolC